MQLSYIVPSPDVIPEHARLCIRYCASKFDNASFVEHLIGVQHENPVTLSLSEDSIPRFGKIILPRNPHYLGTIFLGDLGTFVRRSGIANEDAVDCSSNAIKTAP